MNADRDGGATMGPASLSATQAEELDRACDRFEAEWRAGERPRIEDHLEGIAEPLRSAWLVGLIAVELDRRRRLGERPAPAEYRDRFPARADAVAAAFGPAAGPSRPRAATARSVDPARGLLLGLLAFQNHFVDREALLAALGDWVADRSRPLGRVLVDRGALDAATHALLEALAKKHLEAHDGDAEKSLAALALGVSTREALGRVDDPDIRATLSHVGSGPGPAESDADRTATYRVGSAAGEGQRFRVLRPHAQGGLGAVFVAIDAELNREVALKQILDRHADDPASRARFLLEAEVTGGLEHPGIVPVYGLGAYGDGRPYYAMRFIRGDSLKEAIEHFHAEAAPGADPGRRSLGLRKLLRRFVDVCNAIDYAHSRGVLHRDIKPGNIIVGKYGETLVVDWGLAKALGRSDPGSGERTLRPSSGGSGAETMPGSALGTPAFMSPEQAEGDLDRLGPRSDVYSLGATLYCLLTGRVPFGGEAGAAIAAVRRGDLRPPRQVDPAIDRALEAVCLKAMALRPGDRYESCRALSEEVERWMADEPVLAWREPFSRRARRWGRRHRTTVAGAGAALVAGLIGLAAVAAVQAQSNRDLKEANEKTGRALVAETKARGQMQDALAQSEESRRRAEAVLKFLKDDVLAAARPEGQEGGLGVGVTVRRAVDAAEPKIAGSFKDQPLVEAEVRDTLGLTYQYLGEASSAIRQHERTLELRRARLGPDHPDTFATCNNLADSYHAAGKYAEAIALHESTLKLQEAKLGADHPQTLTTRGNLAADFYVVGKYAEAIALNQAILKLEETKLGPGSPDMLITRDNLANALRAAGRVVEAIALQESTLKLFEAKLGPGHPDTLFCRGNLALAYSFAGRNVEAIAMHESTLKLREERLGADHPDTLTTRGNLALAYGYAGRTAEALALRESTLKRLEAKLGPDHPDTITARGSLAECYRTANRPAEAIPLFESTLERMGAKLGQDHRDTLVCRDNLALAYRAAGRPVEAVALQESTLKVFEAKLGPDHPDTIICRDNLADSYHAAGRSAEAIVLLEAKLRRREVELGPDHPGTFATRNRLASACWSVGRLDRSIPLFEATLERQVAKLGPDHIETLRTLANLGVNYKDADRVADGIGRMEAALERARSRFGTVPVELAWVPAQLADAYVRAGRLAGAEQIYRDQLEWARKQFDPADPRTASAMAQLGANRLRQRKWAEAEAVLRECSAIREKAQPDDWTTFNARSLLGESLMGQEKYAESEPMVLAGYEGMKARAARIPATSRSQLAEAAGRVVRLYEAWGRPGPADEWRRRLGLADLPADVFTGP